jgi:epoxyqueuosine reductase
VKAKVNELADFVRSAGEGVRTRAFVDSGTVLEKAWAQRCGIGWQGKNTLVINRERGSYFFIGIILTDLELDVSEPSANHCGECRRCVEACPTGALDHPYRLDIPNCISYQTLENKDEIPEGIKRKLRDRIYGCDICQDACPFNRHAAGHANPGFQPREQLLNYRKKDWIALTEQDFDLIFAGTPVTRLGYRRFMENIRANSANQ